MSEIRAGYLHKCGGSVKNWKKRWVVVKSNGFLIYYEKKGGKEKGNIDLINSGSVGHGYEIPSADALPAGVDATKAFAIVTKERTYTFYGDSVSDCNDWIASLLQLRSGKSAGPYQGYPAPTNPSQPRPQSVSGPPPYTPQVAAAVPVGSPPMPQPPPYAAPQPPPYAVPQPMGPPMPQPMGQAAPLPPKGPMPQPGYYQPQPYQQPYRQPYQQPYQQPYRQPYQQPYGQPYQQPYRQPYQQPYYPTKPPAQPYYPQQYRQPAPYRAPPPQHRPAQQQQATNLVVNVGGMKINVNTSQQQGMGGR